MAEAQWMTYEKVASYLLNEFRLHFGFERVEGKQKIAGGATDYEIDAKAVLENGVGFLIIECRRQTTSRINQEDAGALAYRIIRSEAEGGILVTPLGLQKGAKKIADAENIICVTLASESTTANYLMVYLDKIFAGLQEAVEAGDQVEAEVTRGNSQAELGPQTGN